MDCSLLQSSLCFKLLLVFSWCDYRKCLVKCEGKEVKLGKIIEIERLRFADEMAVQ